MTPSDKALTQTQAGVVDVTVIANALEGAHCVATPGLADVCARTVCTFIQVIVAGGSGPSRLARAAAINRVTAHRLVDVTRAVRGAVFAERASWTFWTIKVSGKVTEQCQIKLMLHLNKDTSIMLTLLRGHMSEGTVSL